MGRNRSYTEEFRREAVGLVQARGSLQQVARDLGMSHWTLRGWYRERMGMMKKQSSSGGPDEAKAVKNETPEQKLERLERENRQLRKQVDRLEEDRAILKKAAAFFARESE